MNIELYIFNKESKSTPGFTNWESEAVADSKSYKLEIISAKFKSKSLNSDFLKDLNSFIKRSENLTKYFKSLDCSINIVFCRNLSHILYFSDSKLYLDADVKNEFTPFYCFAFYYAALRKSTDKDLIYSHFYDFMNAINFDDKRKLINFLEADKKTIQNYDPGSNLFKFISNLQRDENLSELDKFKEVQLLRNRSLTGLQVYDIEQLGNIYRRNEDDLFSGKACDELYQALNKNLDSNKVTNYFATLDTALQKIGLRLIAQRGSRVAHEQGPILVNANVLNNNASVLDKLNDVHKNIKNSVNKLIDDIRKLEETFYATDFINEFKTDISIILDEIDFLASEEEIPKAKLKKTARELKTVNENLYQNISDYLFEQNYSKNTFNKISELSSNFSKTINSEIYELAEFYKNHPNFNKKSVVYIQRNSERSGHIIARILLGEKLYVETDTNSQKQRLKAIPYTFVSPDFDFVASYVDSFFENASISIVTDSQTGTPSIKWRNAEDLAFTMAASLFKAIQAANNSERSFHYQLETTLFGSSIDKFRKLLEQEISVYASAQFLSPEQIQEKEKSLGSLIENSAELVFDLYQLKSELDLSFISKADSKLNSIFNLIQSYRDIKYDLAALILQITNDENFLNNLKAELASQDFNNSSDRLEYFKTRVSSSLASEEIENFQNTYLSYFRHSIIKELIKENNLEDRYKVSSYQDSEADFHFLFTVAPSRIDFGKNVVSSVTKLMGRMLGADDLDSLQLGKSYIDLVSETENSIFSSSSEAGSAKVIENTCRALQYSKAISFQGVFQSFGIDGYQVRDTINTRDNSKVGIHIMEQGTMASTGYCITKEPLFILHALKENYAGNEYSAFSSELIKHARVINESGIFQRIEIMNQAIDTANENLSLSKEYPEICIALNASYKGNVSDERENANQYLIALLLKQEKFIKNLALEDVQKFYQSQIDQHELPKEIRIFDPFVDPDIFMSGELKEISLNALDELLNILSKFDNELDADVINASLLTYGSNPMNWPLLEKALSELDENFQDDIAKSLKKLAPRLKYLETYSKGFYKDPDLAYQSTDIIQLNSDHKELQELCSRLVSLRTLMKIKNPDSLLILVDNPQQAKKPFLDYDATREWIALGGTVTSHMVAKSKYQEWTKDVLQEKNWAKIHIQKLLQQELAAEEENEYSSYLEKMKKFLTVKRDLLKQKYLSAKGSSISQQRLERYSHSLKTLNKLKNSNYESISFEEWLVLGGRWVLNGEPEQNIIFVKKLFPDFSESILKLYVSPELALEINSKSRLLKQSGSTKEADLLELNASENINSREKIEQENFYKVFKIQKAEEHAEKHSQLELGQIQEQAQKLYDKYIKALNADMLTRYEIWSEIISLSSVYLQQISKFFKTEDLAIKELVYAFSEEEQKEVFEIFFGDHQKSQGLIPKILEGLKNKFPEHGLDLTNTLIELLLYQYLISLTINCDDINIMINKLSVFFDQYINVHEDDYPPYVFHKLCTGANYGFNNEYYQDNKLREKMFKLSFNISKNLYPLLHKLISEGTVLKDCESSYRDSLIGDYENGLIPICYQHQAISIEERFWDCVKALRNFIRNYHDKHPLPIIIKGESANKRSLFGDGESSCKTIYITGISSIGKHSWDLPLVLRSPLFREAKIDSKSKNTYSTITCFTPYLNEDGSFKQIYTSFKPEYIESNEIHYLAPFPNSENKYHLNEYGFVHALINLESSQDLPKPSITMSAHSHTQYINGLTAKLGVPELWSYLNMQQMYSKTELNQILGKAQIPALQQINFKQKAFNSASEVKTKIENYISDNNLSNIEDWLIKSSKESGGRGISDCLNIHQDLNEISEFIFNKSQSDDVVMQEFVPNNAKAFIKTSFYKLITESFIESGIALDTETPRADLYFTMRSFQSVSGAKGYLFSVNAASVTVNAGQGAKLFYGEPIFIMPPYFANKVQYLLDSYGEQILKNAIPEHAKEFAIKNKIDIYKHPGNISNIFMLNGLFDYIPYLYVERTSGGDNDNLQKYKIICEENCFGGLDYYYKYQAEKILLASAKSHEESINKIEDVIKSIKAGEASRIEKNIDVDLAVIELNSGLGQANLLQKALNQAASLYGHEQVDQFMFDEWVQDLESIALSTLPSM